MLTGDLPRAETSPAFPAEDHSSDGAPKPGVSSTGYNFRVYPTPGQRNSPAQAFGCARVVLTGSKKTPERAWLSDVSSVVLQQALADLNAAYRNFFASVTGRRKGA
ncbi:helix-turn-helix domain-containing protein [Nocardia fluminea]|uniref:helix-turn-helix domain-containing protein n=1 Tax=Nocardia fluminea TaxID=134984 RepID=UPI0037FFB538